MPEPGRYVAVISKVHVGLRDVGTPVLWFSVKYEGGGALQVFDWDRAANFISESGARDIKDIGGKTCWVEIKDGLVKFDKFTGW